MCHIRIQNILIYFSVPRTTPVQRAWNQQYNYLARHKTIRKTRHTIHLFFFTVLSSLTGGQISVINNLASLIGGQIKFSIYSSSSSIDSTNLHIVQPNNSKATLRYGQLFLFVSSTSLARRMRQATQATTGTATYSAYSAQQPGAQFIARNMRPHRVC